MSQNFEPVASCQGQAGGVIARDGHILFCAVDESRILDFDPDSGAVSEFRRYTSRISGLAPGPSGRIYAAQSGSRRVVQLNPDGSVSTLSSRLGGRVHNHPFDLTVDGSGRIWFSDPYSAIPAQGPQVFERLGHASVLRLRQLPNRHWTMDRMTTDTSFPGAVQVSADSSTLFVTENDPDPQGRRELRAYPIFADGNLGRPAVLHTFGSDHRGPHRGGYGLCLDAGGRLLLCAGSTESGPGPAVYIFGLDGHISGTLALPENPAACCCLGSEIYVTTVGGRLLRADAG
ncbi:MAG TPA: SMP-30/gluconolactonase/LRE family protein [Candidatus Nitrosotalea sp.]|nr:SMP-30/gluconolactonase/LRE family protein [Candidatus Nitrosotalea sp.]